MSINTNLKQVAIPIPIEDIWCDKESNITRDYTSDIPSMEHDGTNETVIYNAPVRMPRCLDSGGAKITGVSWDYKVTNGAVTSLTPVVNRFDKKIDGTNNAKLTIEMTANTAFDVSVDTTDQKADYDVTNAEMDILEANDSTANAVASTTDAEYRVELTEVVGAATGKLKLYGATVYAELLM